MLTIDLEPDDQRALARLKGELKQAFRSYQYRGEFRGFATMKQLFGVFTPKRWELLQTLQRIGPSSLRGLAGAVGRDVKRVHEDAAALLAEGIIERDAAGKLVVPFAEIHIDIHLTAPTT